MPIRGRPIVNYVLQALHESEVEKVFIVQAEDEGLERTAVPHEKNVWVNCPASRSSLADSVASAVAALVEHYGEDRLSRRNVMVVTCDIPAVRAGDFARLIRQDQDQDSDFRIVLIRHRELRAAFPHRRYRSLFLKDLRGTYSMQTVAIADGRMFGLRASPGDGRQKLVIMARSGEPVWGVGEWIDSLRRHRDGMLFWPYLLHWLLLKGPAARGHGLQGARLIWKFLRRELTVADFERIFDLAVGLKMGVLTSDSVAFSGDIDCPADLDHLLQTGFPPADGNENSA